MRLLTASANYWTLNLENWFVLYIICKPANSASVFPTFQNPPCSSTLCSHSCFLSSELLLVSAATVFNSCSLSYFAFLLATFVCNLCILFFHSIYCRGTLLSSLSPSCHFAGSAPSLPRDSLTVFLQSHYEEERDFTLILGELGSMFAFSHHPCLPFSAACLHLGYFSRMLSRKKIRKLYYQCTHEISFPRNSSNRMCY